MHVLRKTHEAVAPGGALLDIHPVPPPARVEVAGRTVGAFRKRRCSARFFKTVAAAEARLADVAAEGLFAPERELVRDLVERYDDAEELFETRGEEDSPLLLKRRLRALGGPTDVVETFAFRLFRRI